MSSKKKASPKRLRTVAQLEKKVAKQEEELRLIGAQSKRAGLRLNVYRRKHEEAYKAERKLLSRESDLRRDLERDKPFLKVLKQLALSPDKAVRDPRPEWLTRGKTPRLRRTFYQTGYADDLRGGWVGFTGKKITPQRRVFSTKEEAAYFAQHGASLDRFFINKRVNVKALDAVLRDMGYRVVKSEDTEEK